MYGEPVVHVECDQACERMLTKMAEEEQEQQKPKRLRARGGAQFKKTKRINEIETEFLLCNSIRMSVPMIHTLRVYKCNDGNFIHFKLSSFAVCFLSSSSSSLSSSSSSRFRFHFQFILHVICVR